MLGFGSQHLIKNQCTWAEMSFEDGIARFSCLGCWGRKHPRGYGRALAIFRRSPIVETAVEPLFVVIGSILTNGLTGIGQVVKPLPVEAFIKKLPIASQSDRDPCRRQYHAMTEYQPQYITSLRTQCHANTNLPSPLRHRVGNDTEQPRYGQKQRDQSQRAQK